MSDCWAGKISDVLRRYVPRRLQCCCRTEQLVNGESSGEIAEVIDIAAYQRLLDGDWVSDPAPLYESTEVYQRGKNNVINYVYIDWYIFLEYFEGHAWLRDQILRGYFKSHRINK